MGIYCAVESTRFVDVSIDRVRDWLRGVTVADKVGHLALHRAHARVLEEELLDLWTSISSCYAVTKVTLGVWAFFNEPNCWSDRTLSFLSGMRSYAPYHICLSDTAGCFLTRIS